MPHPIDAIKPFDNTARTPAPRTLTWRTWVWLLVLSSMVMGLFLWAFWSPLESHGAAKAAVVNDDEPVTVNGQLVPLGRELAGELTHGSGPYDWTLTDSADARDGLDQGRYVAVVTIPKEFSQRATSTGGDPAGAAQAELRIQTSDAAGVGDALISSQVVQATMRTLNRQIVETYLGNVFVSMGTIHDQLGQAVDGANQLAAGADQLSGGAGKLAGGAGQLAGGLGSAQSKLEPLRDLPPLPGPVGGHINSQIGELTGGVAQAAQGAQQLQGGANQLQGGAQRLSVGAHQLADQLAKGRDQIPVYDHSQRDQLTHVAATPSVAFADTSDPHAAVAALALTLALWTLGLALFLVVRAVPPAVLTSRESTVRIAVRSSIAGNVVAVTVAILLCLILAPIMHLSIGRWFGLTAVSMLAAITFVAINHVLVAVFRSFGRFVSIAVLVITLITGFISTVPALLHQVGEVLPTHAAFLALRGVMVGAAVLNGSVGELVVWCVAGVVLRTLVIEGGRRLSGKQLRLGGELIPSV